MDALHNSYQSIQTGLAVVLRIGGAMLALLLCFTGYRRVRQWISLVAFVAGAVTGFAAARTAGLGEEYWYSPLIIALTAGLVLSLIGYKLFQIGLFVLCGAVSSWAVTAHVLPGILGGPEAALPYYGTTILQMLVFVVGGVLAVKFSRTAIILITAIGGARYAAACLVQLLPAYFPDSSKQMFLFAGLAVLGILIQFLTTRSGARK